MLLHFRTSETVGQDNNINLLEPVILNLKKNIKILFHRYVHVRKRFSSLTEP